MELIQQYGKNLIVDLVSKETEDYKPPPLKPFSGQGQTLGRLIFFTYQIKLQKL